MELRAHIRDVPDFPKKGIVFKDITPMLGNAKALAHVVQTMAAHYQGKGDPATAGGPAEGTPSTSLVLDQFGRNLT